MTCQDRWLLHESQFDGGAFIPETDLRQLEECRSPEGDTSTPNILHVAD